MTILQPRPQPGAPAPARPSERPNSKPKAPPTWVIALSVSSAVMGLTLLTPALPTMRVTLNASSSEVQQLLTVYMVALAVGQLIYGTLSDRVGRRPVLLFGALLYGVSGVAAALIHDIETLTVCRIIQGIGAAACLSMGRALINDCFERTEAARHMSTVAMMLAIVPILSLGLGGFLVDWFGWPATMIVSSAAGFLVFVAALKLVAETNINPSRSINVSAVVSAYASVLKNRIFVLFSMTSGMQVGMFFALNAFLPYQYQRLGYSPIEFGLWFSLTPLCYLLGNTFNRLYFVSRGIERAAMIGCAGSLVSVIALYATQAAGMQHALSLALPGCLFGLSNGIIVGNATIGAMSAAGVHAGTGTGLTGAWQMAAGGIAGAVIVGLGGAQNFQLAAGALILMSLVSVTSIYFVYRQSLTH